MVDVTLRCGHSARTSRNQLCRLDVMNLIAVVDNDTVTSTYEMCGFDREPVDLDMASSTDLCGQRAGLTYSDRPDEPVDSNRL